MEGSNPVCLIIHGFTGGPYEVMPLAKHLKGLGYLTSVPTLAGHTGNLNDLANVNYKDWIASAESVLVKLLLEHEKVNIIGFSMGGLIGVYLANKYKINTLVMLSSPIYVGEPKNMALHICRDMRNKNYQRIKRYVSNCINTPIKAVINFKIMVHIMKPLIKKIQIPTLVLQGLKDDVVRPKSAQYIHDNIAAADKQIHYLPNSAHLVCCDVEKERVFQLVNNFIQLH
ncbi:MAG: alpha/beta fold hydrolase [Firmicutes bacterium]|nr:alpha/beta fold hydrolase [Bacillota bacterium]